MALRSIAPLSFASAVRRVEGSAAAATATIRCCSRAKMLRRLMIMYPPPIPLLHSRDGWRLALQVGALARRKRIKLRPDEQDLRLALVGPPGMSGAWRDDDGL